MSRMTEPFVFGQYLAYKDASELYPNDKKLAKRAQETKELWLYLSAELKSEKVDAKPEAKK